MIQYVYERARAILSSLITFLTGLQLLVFAFADEVTQWGLPSDFSADVTTWSVRVAVGVGAVIALIRKLTPTPVGTEGLVLPAGVRLVKHASTHPDSVLVEAAEAAEESS